MSIIDEKKPRISLIPRSAIWATAEAFTYGASKHGDFSWKENSHTLTQMLDKALRHISQFSDGQDFDDDSKLLHLGSACADLCIAIDIFTNYKGLDDRFKKQEDLKEPYVNTTDETQMILLLEGQHVEYPDGTVLHIQTQGQFPVKPGGVIHED